MFPLDIGVDTAVGLAGIEKASRHLQLWGVWWQIYHTGQGRSGGLLKVVDVRASHTRMKQKH